MEKRFRRIFLAASFFLAFSSALWSQISSSTGAIQGSVTDPQNAAIAGAKVTLSNTSTNSSVETTSLKDGTFVFPLLAPGNYNIRVMAPGFESTQLDGVIVEITRITNANAKLRIGQVSTVATVNE